MLRVIRVKEIITAAFPPDGGGGNHKRGNFFGDCDLPLSPYGFHGIDYPQSSGELPGLPYPMLVGGFIIIPCEPFVGGMIGATGPDLPYETRGVIKTIIS